MPDWKTLIRARLAPLSPLDAARAADIVDELAQHVAEHDADLVAAGVAEADAVDRALALLNDPARLAREIARADRPRRWAPVPPPAGGSALGHVGRDILYALRLLPRVTGFAVAAIVTLTLGIGANVAIFSVVRAVVLKPPPYRDPSRVVAFLNSRSGNTASIYSSSLPDYQDWTRQLTSFESMGLLSGWTFNITSLELPERVFGARVTGSLFPTLGTPPLLGRGIEPADDQPGSDEVVVLGYAVWQRLFAGDRDIVGRAVMMEGRPHIVIGVMPPRFRFPMDDVELWAAIKDNLTGMPRNSRFMAVVGRLKAAVTVTAAQAEVDTASAQLQTAYPQTNNGWRVRLAGAHDAVVGDSKPALIALAGAVGFVLLILTKIDPLQPIYQLAPLDSVVAQSVAARRFHTGLIDLFALLALALCAVGVYGTIGYWVAERSRDIGVRMALGATARRIRAMVVARASSLTAVGVALGTGLSLATSRLLSSLLFEVRPFDASTIATAAIVVLTASAAAAYVPTRRASSVDPLRVIRGE